MASCRAVVNSALNLRALSPRVVASIAAVNPIVGYEAEFASQVCDTLGVKFVTGGYPTWQIVGVRTRKPSLRLIYGAT